MLGKTLGVPLFQEQAMRLAMVAAGFTGGGGGHTSPGDGGVEAQRGASRKFHDKFVDGMIGHGYELEFAERCFKQISGFGEYGFPESHAASFALLVYARRGSSGITRRRFARRCSTASRWVFTRRPRSCAMRRSMAWKCGRWM